MASTSEPRLFRVDNVRRWALKAFITGAILGAAAVSIVLLFR